VEYAGDFEVGGLHDGVNPVTHARAAGDFGGVNHIEFQFFVDDALLHFDGKLFPYIRRFEGAVEEEGAAGFDLGQHIVHFHVGEFVTCKEVRCIDKIRTANNVFAETQMRNGETAGFF